MKQRKHAHATYLYCLVANERPPRLGRVRGLPGADRPRSLDAGRGLWLVAADAPLNQYGAAAIERGLRTLDWVSACAVAHEAVVEECAKSGTVVPMKLFTLFASDERARAHIGRLRPKLERVLQRIQGCREWGLRVHLDPQRALAIAQRKARRAAGPVSSGRSFLLRKKTEQEAKKNLGGLARAQAGALYEQLARKARAARRRLPPAGPIGARLLLDAVFLVPEPRRDRFRAAADGAAERLEAQGYRVTLTGPWPPYHFVS